MYSYRGIGVPRSQSRLLMTARLPLTKKLIIVLVLRPAPAAVLAHADCLIESLAGELLLATLQRRLPWHTCHTYPADPVVPPDRQS